MPGISRRAGSLASGWSTLAVCALLTGLTWIVFGQTLRHGFVNYDDGIYLYENPIVRKGLTPEGVAWAFTHRHGATWHPLTTISHMLDCHWFGLKAGGHHFTNVLFHNVSAILLFLGLQRMTGGLGGNGNIWRSAFVAALFAVHPLHVESVAWAAERKDVLSGVFFMLTLIAYSAYVTNRSLGRYLLVAALFALGLMCKPMLVTLPFVLLLLDYWPLNRGQKSEVRSRKSDLQSSGSGRRIWSKLIVEKTPLLALSLVSCAVTLIAQSGAIATTQRFPLGWRINNAVVSYITYLWQLFWPTKLAVFYPHLENRVALWQTIFAVTFLLAISVVSFLLRKTRPYLLTGWCWYAGMLVPVIGVVQVGSQGHADRYTYLPHIGVYLSLTWLAADLLRLLPYRRQVLSLGGAAAIVTGLSWCAWNQTSHWRDSETLWRRAVAVTTRNDVAHANLAEVLLLRGRAKEAILHSQEALAIRPNNPNAYNNLGLALFQTGEANAAVANWRKSLEIQPHNMNAQSNLAWVFATCPEASVRDGAKAVELTQKVIRRVGFRSPIILRTLAAAYAENAQFGEAIKAAQEALQLAASQGNSGLVADLQGNIANYQRNIPLRDPSLANVRR